jgi:hypothetical protein
MRMKKLAKFWAYYVFEFVDLFYFYLIGHKNDRNSAIKQGTSGVHIIYELYIMTSNWVFESASLLRSSK